GLLGSTVWVFRSYTLSARLEALHSCLGATSGVVSSSPPPERPAMVSCGAQGLVTRQSGSLSMVGRFSGLG
ncbi:MAG: hypothetical protein VX259_07200, partial [Pseudomonadota bacterium]|nr:hypothetical protein [Pseudomonadota bacterium]